MMDWTCGVEDCIVLSAAYPKAWLCRAEPQTTRLEWHGYIPARMATSIGWVCHWVVPPRTGFEEALEVVRMLGRDLACARFPGGELSRKTEWENMKWENKVKEGVLCDSSQCGSGGLRSWDGLGKEKLETRYIAIRAAMTHRRRNASTTSRHFPFGTRAVGVGSVGAVFDVSKPCPSGLTAMPSTVPGAQSARIDQWWLVDEDELCENV